MSLTGAVAGDFFRKEANDLRMEISGITVGIAIFLLKSSGIELLHTPGLDGEGIYSSLLAALIGGFVYNKTLSKLQDEGAPKDHDGPTEQN